MAVATTGDIASGHIYGDRFLSNDRTGCDLILDIANSRLLGLSKPLHVVTCELDVSFELLWNTITRLVIATCHDIAQDALNDITAVGRARLRHQSCFFFKIGTSRIFSPIYRFPVGILWKLRG